MHFHIVFLFILAAVSEMDAWDMNIEFSAGQGQVKRTLTNLQAR
jgi:hypothetical protein